MNTYGAQRSSLLRGGGAATGASAFSGAAGAAVAAATPSGQPVARVSTWVIVAMSLSTSWSRTNSARA